MCGKYHDHDHEHVHAHENRAAADPLAPLRAAPDPGYPAWEYREAPRRGGALRQAAAATTVSLALCFGACRGEEETAPTPIETVADDRPAKAPEPPATPPPDPDDTMNGARLGMPLALALTPEERSPGSMSRAQAAAEGEGGGGVPESATGAQVAVINLTPIDVNVADVMEPVAKPRPRPRPVRMSGCSGMASLRR